MGILSLDLICKVTLQYIFKQWSEEVIHDGTSDPLMELWAIHTASNKASKVQDRIQMPLVDDDQRVEAFLTH